MSAAKQRHLALEDYLSHIEEAAAMASRYVRGLTKEQFLADPKTQQAVIYNILILGEAATQIINEYHDFAAAHPEIP